MRAVDEASDPWGIKVTRYEIKDISPTETIEEAMKQQMRAEREKRAEILSSEGDKAARINVSKGQRQEAINLSMGEKQRRINESDGRAQSIEIISKATAQGIREIAQAIKTPGGDKATRFRIAEQFISQFGNIVENAETSILPFDLAQFKSLIQTVMGDTEKGEKRKAAPGPDILLAGGPDRGGAS